ncbi:MAG: FAD-binding oxidoreductase, partial [Dehalococcoidia bacterium]|nr:FAD-binding oxidoreductase [Dehalococcoidia bacterium]
ESDAIAAGASGGAAGLLSPPSPHTSDTPVYELQRRGFDMHMELGEVLPAESGVDYGFARSSRVSLAVTEEEEANARATIDALTSAGRESRWLDPSELHEVTEWIDGGTARGAALLDGGGYVDAYRYSLALVTAAERMGATVRSGKVSGVETQDGRASGVRVGDEVVPADVVVIAMGPWSSEASDWLGLRVPVEPLKGQIVKVRPPRALPIWQFGHGGNYGIAKSADVVFLGTTEERTGFDVGTTTEARDEILEFGVGFASELEGAELIEQTACLRPLSEDGVPIMGRVPGIEGAFVATGHGRQGILQSPPSGLAMAELILNGETRVLDMTPFDPARFGPA